MIVDLVFLASVVVIWSMTAYQLVLTVAGYFYAVQSSQDREVLSPAGLDWPTVSVLVPAHNEERVIRATVQALLEQDYPSDRLEIVVINDGSTDRTGELVEDMMARAHPLRVVNISAAEGARGKSRALNEGLKVARGDIIAVYDADNTPEPDALRLLVVQLLRHPELGAALGKFRTLNRRRNLLTRLINLETLAFQWITQAGRWNLVRVALLPGTNYVVWRRVLEDVGPWDERAMSEDAELSVRLYEKGYLIKFVPAAVTYEQEPETLGVWVRQRTRWVRGHNYVLSKFLTRVTRFRSPLIAVELLSFLCLHYLFLIGIVASDILFVLSLFSLAQPSLTGPFAAVWALAFLLFVLELVLIASLEDESLTSVVALAVVMYFIYCQGWLYVVVRGFTEDVVLRKERVWHKTPRFETTRT